MKKIILALTCCIAILAACNNDTKTAENKDSVTFAPDASTAAAPATAPADTASKMAPAAPAAKAEVVDTEKGKALIAKSDCLGCHKVDQKLVGPAYKAVAAKYTMADVDKLAAKVIAGGAGNWGQVPMSPHPALSKDDAKEMVKYILSLK